MPLARLISAKALQDLLGQPQLCVLDCRFDLANVQLGQQLYAKGHIPGAQFIDLETELSGDNLDGISGRHPLPTAESLCETLRQKGCDNDSTIVLYDQGNGSFACRAWWLLVWLGKTDNVFLLDGGYQAWLEASGPVSHHPSVASKGSFTGQANPSLLISAEQIRQQLQQPTLTLIDARTLARYRGEVEPIDPVAGHIPSAECLPFTENLGPDGRFLPPEQLRKRFARVFDKPSRQVVGYCGSGVTACHNLFACCLAGYPLPKLFAPSWSGWISVDSNPVANN